MDPKDHLSPNALLPRAGHLPLEQVAQGLIQTGFKHCQVCGIQNVPQQSLQFLTTLTGRNYFLISNLNFPFQFVPVTSCPITKIPDAGRK